jgi:hypothetical protein
MPVLNTTYQIAKSSYICCFIILIWSVSIAVLAMDFFAPGQLQWLPLTTLGHSNTGKV